MWVISENVYKLLCIMDGSSTYQHSASLDTEFRRLSQNIGSNVQKILQNGKYVVILNAVLQKVLLFVSCHL
mgnify:CR=1 FL=1